MAYRTLAQLRQRARARSNTPSTNFATDAEVNGLINVAYQQLYSFLDNLDVDYAVDSIDFTLLAGQDGYVLPTSIARIKGIDHVTSATEAEPLVRFDWHQRNSAPTQYKYNVIGTKIKIIPAVTSDTDFRTWFIPLQPEFQDEADLIWLLADWEEYVVLCVAINLLLKEKTDTSQLVAERMRAEEKITKSTIRDSGLPPLALDVDEQDENINWWRRY